MELIPSIDLRGGQVVRLFQGDYARETVYGNDPGAVAADFALRGARRIHVVDLDAARDGVAGNEAAIRAILRACAGVPVQVGGGVRSLARVEALLALGVDRVVIGTAALDDPEMLRTAASRFPNRVVLGVDTRDGRVAVRGWRETSSIGAAELLARFDELPLAAALHTDIGRDATQLGANVEASAALARATRFPVLASGGVGALAHLEALARARVIAGVIVGKALYAGAFTVDEALARLASL